MKKSTLGLALFVLALCPLFAAGQGSPNQLSYQQFKGEIISYDPEVRELKLKSKLGEHWFEQTFELTKGVEVYRYMVISQAGEEVEKYLRLALDDLKKETAVTVLYRVQEGRNLVLSIELRS